MHASAFYAPSVQLGAHPHMYTTQHNQHMRTCAERHRAKRPQGK